MIWLIIGILLLITEMIQPIVFLFFFFGFSAVLTALLVYFGATLFVSLIFFLSFSLALILFVRPLIVRYSKFQSASSQMDELIGKTGIAIEPIAPHEFGLVKVSGKDWSAESQDTIAQGSEVEVLEVEGTHLIVKRKDSE